MCSVREALTMRSSRVLSLFFIVSLLLLDEVIVSGKPSCPAGHFRNQTTASALVHCSPCSTCAINHIVRKPCNRQNDTVCGPFYEFEFFNQRQQKPNQASDGLGWKRTMMKGDTEAEEDGGGGDGRHGHHLFYGQQTTNSPGEEGESSSLRCGQATEWRVLCYGLVAAVVIVISVALSAVALFSYCRANAKTLRVSAETSRATSIIVTDADAPSSSSSAADHPSSSSSAALTSSSTTTTTIVVDRSVRHLEEQLFHNERRRAFLRWLFGSSDAASDRLFSSNDYLEERHRRRFLLLLEPSSSTASSARGRPTDALPLQPYPGMISTTARTDHDRSSQHPFTAAAAAAGGASDDGEAEDEAGRGNRMDRMPRSDEGSQADEQVSNHGERSRLIPEQ